MRLIQAVTLVLLSAGLLAQEAPTGGNLELMTVVEKVREIAGPDGATRTELEPVETAVPGDEVVYTVTFTNIGEETAENVRITNPIPPQMRYVDGTAFGPGTDVLYSTDGGASYGVSGELMVRSDDGSERPAGAADYTHIRWVLNAPLDAGAKGFARFRAVLQ